MNSIARVIALVTHNVGPVAHGATMSSGTHRLPDVEIAEELRIHFPDISKSKPSGRVINAAQYPEMTLLSEQSLRFMQTRGSQDQYEHLHQLVLDYRCHMYVQIIQLRL